jgi:hypothetical protein
VASGEAYALARQKCTRRRANNMLRCRMKSLKISAVWAGQINAMPYRQNAKCAILEFSKGSIWLFNDRVAARLLHAALNQST